jgi:hypothetical protein
VSSSEKQELRHEEHDHPVRYLRGLPGNMRKCLGISQVLLPDALQQDAPNVFPTVGQLRESGTNCRTAVSVARSIQLYQTARPQHPTPPKRVGVWTIRWKIESGYPVIPNPWWVVTAKHGQATVTFNEGS